VERGLPDAPAPDAERADATPPDAATPDAAQVACTHVASTSASPLLAFTVNGGSFESHGCAPVDPTFWLAASGVSVTIDFADPQDRPSIRVWGMNDDDIASVAVNGAAYALDSASGSLDPKVTCGLSPGPDGVAFSGGNLVGTNTNSEGNYSYQDVTLETTSVTQIVVAGVAGAGWGFAGVSVGCAN
jgi:hypothetical protein